MFKAMILLKRNDDLSFDEFKDHWLNHHAPMVRQLPGLRKAIFNFETGDGDGEIDAVSELWFDSETDFTNAYASDIGIQVAEDSISRVSRRQRILLDEHEVFPG